MARAQPSENRTTERPGERLLQFGLVRRGAIRIPDAPLLPAHDPAHIDWAHTYLAIGVREHEFVALRMNPVSRVGHSLQEVDHSLTRKLASFERFARGFPLSQERLT